MGTSYVPTPREAYLNIEVPCETLYIVTRLQFAEDTPRACMPLQSRGTLTAGLIISQAIKVSPLQSQTTLKCIAHVMHIGSALVGWSDIGSIDFRKTRENIAGDAYMQWLGEVYQIKKLGNCAIVYGSGGVTKMTPAESHFGFDETPVPGIKGKLSICGDDTVHFFISQEGFLYRYARDGEPERLGYRRFLKNLSDATVLSMSANRSEVWACDGVLGFHITDKGIGQCNPFISGSVSFYETNYVCGPPLNKQSCLTYRRDNLDPDSGGPELCTDDIDFGFPGFKSLATVRISGTVNANSKVMVEYLGSDFSFKKHKWVPVHPSGVAYIGVSATKFRVRVRNVNELSDLVLTYKKDDRRFSRASLPTRGDAI